MAPDGAQQPLQSQVACAIVLDSSLAIASRIHAILGEYLSPILNRLRESYPGHRLKLAVVTYGPPDYYPSPIITKNFFNELPTVLTIMRDDFQQLGIGSTNTPEPGMTALDGLIAAQELFDMLDDTLPRTPNAQIIRHIIHIAASEPSVAEKPLWNDFPAYDDLTWQSLPGQLKKSNIHYSAILLQSKLSKFLTLSNDCLEGKPVIPWFNVRPGDDIRLSGIEPPKPQTPAPPTTGKRSADASISQPETKRQKTASVDLSGKEKAKPTATTNTSRQPTQASSSAPPKPTPPSTSDAPINLTDPNPAVIPPAPGAPQPATPPQGLPPGQNPDQIRMMYQMMQSKAQNCQAKFKVLEVQLNAAKQNGDSQRLELIMNEKKKLAEEMIQLKHAHSRIQAFFAAQQSKLSGGGQNPLLGAVAPSAMSNPPTASPVMAQAPSDPSAAAAVVAAMSAHQRSMSGSSPHLAQPQSATPTNPFMTSPEQPKAESSNAPGRPPSGISVIPNEYRAQMQKIVEEQKRRGSTTQPPEAPSVFGSPSLPGAAAQAMPLSTPSLDTPRPPMGVPQSMNNKTPLWEGSLTILLNNAQGSPTEIRTQVLANSPHPDPHVDSWPKNFAIQTTTTSKADVKSFQSWVATMRPIMAQFQPQQGADQTNFRHYQMIAKFIDERPVYCIARWESPGRNTAQALIMMVNQRICASILPDGIKAFPQPSTSLSGATAAAAAASGVGVPGLPQQAAPGSPARPMANFPPGFIQQLQNMPPHQRELVQQRIRQQQLYAQTLSNPAAAAAAAAAANKPPQQASPMNFGMLGMQAQMPRAMSSPSQGNIATGSSIAGFPGPGSSTGLHPQQQQQMNAMNSIGGMLNAMGVGGQQRQGMMGSNMTGNFPPEVMQSFLKRNPSQGGLNGMGLP